MTKRIFDLIGSLVGLFIVSPFLLIVALLIVLIDDLPILYRSSRVGRNGVPFRIFKFRTMVTGADQVGGSSTACDDPRVTKLGNYLRKYKIDELPQLINVLKGEMSLVGPRPELSEILANYPAKDREVILSVLPGITDYGSLKFHDEGQLLLMCDDPEKTYIETVMNEKIKLQLQCISDSSWWNDIKIIFATISVLIATRLRKDRS